MNRTRMLVFAFFALALSGLVAYYAYRMLSNRLSPPTEETVQIVVATEKLTLGNRLNDAQLRVGSAIPEGMRAVAVRVNDVIGVAGFVVPGTHVDIMIIGSPGPNGVITSKIFLENVQVLAAGQNVERDVNGKPQTSQVVTMLVTPEDAQKLALAGDARIQLALRNPIDMAVENPKGVQTAMLYGTSSAGTPPEAPRPRARPMVVKYAPKPKPEIAAPVVSVEPAVRTVTVEVIRGDKRETSTFQMKPK